MRIQPRTSVQHGWNRIILPATYTIQPPHAEWKYFYSKRKKKIKDHNGAAEYSIIENDDDDVTISAQNNENSEQVLFSGFDSTYENMVALEDQILCKEFQDDAGEKYEKIASHL